MKKFLLTLFVVSLFAGSVPSAEAGPLCRIGKAVKKRLAIRKARKGNRRIRIFRRCR